MRALSSLGKTSESYGTMSTPSVWSKLPVKIKRLLVCDHHESEWSIIMSGLLKEIQILDMSQQHSGRPVMHDSIPPPTASFQTHVDKFSHPWDGQQRKHSECPFCKRNHKANNCDVVIDPKQRLAIVKRDNLCFNSLAQHKASQCNSRFTCRKCKKHHHTSLCRCFPADSKSPIPSTQLISVTQPPSNQAAAMQPPTAEQTSGLTTLASTPCIPMSACYKLQLLTYPHMPPLLKATFCLTKGHNIHSLHNS